MKYAIKDNNQKRFEMNLALALAHPKITNATYATLEIDE